MSELKKVGLGSYIKSSRRRGHDLGEEFSITYDDISGLYSYLNFYKNILEKTTNEGTVEPLVNGLDGDNLLVSSGVTSGSFYNSSAERSKTLSEALLEIYNAIDVALASSDVSTLLLDIKEKIGQNLFDSSVLSVDSSLDKQVQFLNLRVGQIAADCFNRGREIGDAQDSVIYNISEEGKQTQEYSLRDYLDKILEIHGGINDLGHSDLAQKMVWASNFKSAHVVSGGEEKYSAPFANEHKDLAEAEKFYNPMSNPIKISRLYTYISDNTLADNITITVYKNGLPTSVQLHVAGGTNGSASYDETEVTIEPNSYIQFKTKAGTVNAGSAHIANISITLQEKI